MNPSVRLGREGEGNIHLTINEGFVRRRASLRVVQQVADVLIKASQSNLFGGERRSRNLLSRESLSATLCVEGGKSRPCYERGDNKNAGLV